MLQAILGLIFVILILYLIFKLIQKYGKGSIINGNSSDRAKIIGVTYIDESTKIISATHGPMRYLFVIGKNTSLLLDKYENKEL